MRVGYKTLSVENFDLVQYFSGENAITDGARAETGLKFTGSGRLGLRDSGSGRARAWPYLALSLSGLSRSGRASEICIIAL